MDPHTVTRRKKKNDPASMIKARSSTSEASTCTSSCKTWPATQLSRSSISFGTILRHAVCSGVCPSASGSIPRPGSASRMMAAIRTAVGCGLLQTACRTDRRCIIYFVRTGIADGSIKLSVKHTSSNLKRAMGQFRFRYRFTGVLSIVADLGQVRAVLADAALQGVDRPSFGVLKHSLVLEHVTLVPDRALQMAYKLFVAISSRSTSMWSICYAQARVAPALQDRHCPQSPQPPRPIPARTTASPFSASFSDQMSHRTHFSIKMQPCFP